MLQDEEELLLIGHRLTQLMQRGFLTLIKVVEIFIEVPVSFRIDETEGDADIAVVLECIFVFNSLCQASRS